jgi:hypothetical protein
VNKKKHKNTLGGKNMEILFLKIAVRTAVVAMSKVCNHHAQEIVLRLSKDLKINYMLRINTRFRMSDTFISNTFCAYRSSQVDKVCEVFET